MVAPNYLIFSLLIFGNKVAKYYQIVNKPGTQN